MKTFTLRLTELEAEALERLAALHKVSMNQYIKDLITEEYCDYDAHASCVDGELDSIASETSFPLAVYESIEHLAELGKVADCGPYPFIPTIRACRYVLENRSGELTAEEEARISDFEYEMREEARNA